VPDDDDIAAAFRAAERALADMEPFDVDEGWRRLLDWMIKEGYVAPDSAAPE
jgi:hypothetical protein